MVLRTEDADEASALLGDAAVPYRFQSIADSPRFATEILILKGRSIVLSTASTAGRMSLETRMPADSIGLVLDLDRGVGIHRSEGAAVDVSPRHSFVHNSSAPAEVGTRDKYRLLFLRIAADELKAELGRRLGSEPSRQLVFQPALDMRTVAGQELRQAAGELRRVLCATGRSSVESSVAIAQLESRIMNLLLEAQPHNYSRMMSRHSVAGTWQLRAAEEYMRSCAHLPLSLGDICSAAGVNSRTLQYSFQRYRGCSPMAFLQQIRMDGAHADLLAPDEGTTVAGVASKWGFLHFGRFSQSYRRLFGERPSQTLRRSQRKA